MKYITGIKALNIDNRLNTCGDWHTSALDWQNIELAESDGSLLGDWGVETEKIIPEHDNTYNVANDLRAILDLMASGHIRFLRGFKRDFIDTDEYDDVFFEKAYMLRELDNWGEINYLMRNEFRQKWVDFIDTKEVNTKEVKTEVTGGGKPRDNRGLILDFLKFLNTCSWREFILKGRAALLLFYNMCGRTNTIYLDGYNRNIVKYAKNFMKSVGGEHGDIKLRITEDTLYRTRMYIEDIDDVLLNIEVSYNRTKLTGEECEFIDGVAVYTLSSLLSMELIKFGDKRVDRSLDSIVYIYNNYKNKLNDYIVMQLKYMLAYYGAEYFKDLPEYLEELDYNSFMNMYNDLGLQ